MVVAAESLVVAVLSLGRCFLVVAQHPDEVAIVNGVLQTAEKSVAEAMITMDKVTTGSSCCARQHVFFLAVSWCALMGIYVYGVGLDR